MSRRQRQVVVLALGLVVAGGAGWLIARETSDSDKPGSVRAGAGDLTVRAGTLPTYVGNGNPVAGKPLFGDMKCGGCHIVAKAGGHGTVGTNLDEDPPEYDLLLDTMRNGIEEMPSFKDRLTDQQIQDLAAYVVTVTR